MLKAVGGAKVDLVQVWESALRSHRYRAGDLAAVFTQLHTDGQFDSVVEGLQAAIRNDQAEPWMYDILAFEMKLAERPQKEIDRALLSRVDFSAANEAQALLTIAYLLRFDALDRARQLCEEVIDRNPFQSAAWAMAGRIADRSQSTDDLLWSRCGTIENVWADDFETLHARAETELQDHAKRLRLDGHVSEADRVLNRLAEAKRRDLRIRLTWAGDADVDLIVKEPGRGTCSWRNPVSVNGGLLIRQADGRTGSGHAGRQTEEYVCVRAPSGQFELTVRLVLGRVITGRVRVDVIQYENTPGEKTTTVTEQVGERDAVVKIELNSGRRDDDLRDRAGQ
ncbi:MAG: hypothetical protein KDA81_18745 [Planctomycetaceae bacterium]|nr:hypothetical protein [Planctomycetaceae bacterium]